MINAIVDLSHHNMTDIPTLAANGILGIVHKATQGLTFNDSRFSFRKDAAQSLGLLWGAYHFGIGGDGQAQAQHFLSVAGLGGIQVLDFESAPQGATDMSICDAEAFVTTIHTSTGKWPLIYADPTHVRDLLAESDVIPSNCPLWLAQYTPTPTAPVQTAWPTPWVLWQYNDGSLRFHPQRFEQGIDADMFNGDEDGLNTFWTAQLV